VRIMEVSTITQSVKQMCIEANLNLAPDVTKALQTYEMTEESPIGKQILKDLLMNVKIAQDKQVPICQDTGMAVFFVEIGQEVHFSGGYIEDAINEGVRQGYLEGFLRKSIVADPLRRVNTKDNTPAIIHYQMVLGDQVKITFAPKGFGSENMSRSKMLVPSEGRKGVVDFVLETVSLAGPNPCPPIVVGVGIGGTLEKAAIIAKKATAREIGLVNQDPYYELLEKELLEKVNGLGIGPQGLGGTTTALAVHVETFATHIAGLPVVVNINCHAARHMTVIL
jgi:fumarate hydratase subunit alpha